MNKVMKASGGVVLGALIAGCATVNPVDVEQTARDREVYTPTASRPVHEGQYKMAVVSSMIKHVEGRHDHYTQEQMEAAVQSSFANLGWFETVDRKNGVALDLERFKVDPEAMDFSKVQGVDLILFAKSKLSYLDDGMRSTNDSGKCRYIKVWTEFRLVDVQERKPILVKQYEVKSYFVKGSSAHREAINAGCLQNARSFANLTAASILPEVKVLQTRGDGEYAQVGMGMNYQLIPGSVVDFCYIEKNDEPGGKVSYDNAVFAHGSVLSVESKKSWVHVDNYEKAGVKKGHSAIVHISE